MQLAELDHYLHRFRHGNDIFHELMQYKVTSILFISSIYDSFIFQEDGRLSEEILGEYYRLNLTSPPRICSVHNGDEALQKLEENTYDLVITMMRIGTISPFELSARIKERSPKTPVILLLNIQADLVRFDNHEFDTRYLDHIFFWNGDTTIFIAMIKHIEDLKNVEYDTQKGLVRVILLVEDSIKYYSLFLPILYTEVMKQTQRLISDELNDTQKHYRMRSRPKVLLARTYEEAISVCQKYKEYLLAIISDVSFHHNQQLDPTAGIQLIRALQTESFDTVYLIQSSDLSHKSNAEQLGAHFLHKDSKTLLNDISHFILTYLGFGDFIFRDETGNEISRSSSMSEFEHKLEAIPEESLLYHSRRNHFSAWLIARGEIQVARRIRPVKDSDFPNPYEHRQFLVNVFREVWSQKNRGRVIEFESTTIHEEQLILRLKNGSLGGKGRGLAFINALLVSMNFEQQFKNSRIRIPKTAIIGTDEYDEFIESNHLIRCLDTNDDHQIKQQFLNGQLSHELNSKLKTYLHHMRNPLAVRSSGLLEDCQSQPFAGVYQTFMIPNNEKDDVIRFNQLSDAIKLVFSSVYLKNARTYIERIRYRVEEEKMGIVLQEIVGNQYGIHYYPHFSGVAQSYNYYPISYMKSNDGVASIAVGLGQTVVEGERHFRFCPRYPELHSFQLEEIAKHSQTHFYAINMNHSRINLIEDEYAKLIKLDIRQAEQDGTLQHSASVWDQDNHRIVDGLSTHGPRIINFSDILKYKYFPLSDVIIQLLEMGEKAMGLPVEIEFAVNLSPQSTLSPQPTFYVLQIRPLTVTTAEINIQTETINRDELIIYSEHGMGNGSDSTIHDIILVDPARFRPTHTVEMLQEIRQLDQIMERENRSYILIGPGRWGSRDRFLGIPVQWNDIHRAKIIVEAGIEGFDVEASQGSHFFHNLVAMGIGYLTVPYHSRNSFIDWQWMLAQPPIGRTPHFIHIRQTLPFPVLMDGKKGISIIYKSLDRHNRYTPGTHFQPLT